MSGIAVTLFIRAVGTILRKRRSTGKVNLPFVLPSVLIFILATVVSSASFQKFDRRDIVAFRMLLVYGSISMRRLLLMLRTPRPILTVSERLRKRSFRPVN